MQRDTIGKLAPLAALYFAQGLPFGVQSTALPLLLRERGASLEAVGFSGLLAAPWMAKALWAPLVDRYGWTAFGRRKSWIVPMQLALALAALAAAFVHAPAALAGLILLMNLFAATQDIAVDALAVSWLQPGQLGPGNALQVVGYKLGMLTGGGLLVWASGWIGWSGLFLAVAGLMVLIALWSSRLDEPNSEVRLPPAREIRGRLLDALRQPGTRALLIVMLTYKSGESMADAMWKPLLLDRGVAASDIGLWAGTWGMLCSLFGTSYAGVLAGRFALPILLVWIASLRALSLVGEWWAAAAPLEVPALIAITCGEHLAGGAITTIVFALMMRHTDREIGATHYTLLASVEVLGKVPLGALSGLVARALGYERLFAIAVVLSLAFILLAWALRRPLAQATAEATWTTS